MIVGHHHRDSRFAHPLVAAGDEYLRIHHRFAVVDASGILVENQLAHRVFERHVVLKQFAHHDLCHRIFLYNRLSLVVLVFIIQPFAAVVEQQADNLAFLRLCRIQRKRNDSLHPPFSALRSPFSALRSSLSVFRSPFSVLRSSLSAFRQVLVVRVALVVERFIQLTVQGLGQFALQRFFRHVQQRRALRHVFRAFHQVWHQRNGAHYVAQNLGLADGVALDILRQHLGFEQDEVALVLFQILLQLGRAVFLGIAVGVLSVGK